MYFSVDGLVCLDRWAPPKISFNPASRDKVYSFRFVSDFEKDFYTKLLAKNAEVCARGRVRQNIKPFIVAFFFIRIGWHLRRSCPSGPLGSAPRDSDPQPIPQAETPSSRESEYTLKI